MFCILLDRLLKIHSISGSYAIHYSSSLVNIFNLKSFIFHKSPPNLLQKDSFPAVCADPSWHKSSDTFVHLSRHPLSPLTNITPMRRPKCHRFIKNASTCYPKPVLWLPFRPWLQITGATASAQRLAPVNLHRPCPHRSVRRPVRSVTTSEDVETVCKSV